MATINPYINFGGKTKEALEFYKDVFGGELDVQLAKDGPAAAQVPEGMGEMVFHGELHSGAIIIMASDMMMDPADPPQMSTVISIAVGCDSAKQLQEMFDKLVAGGKEIWPVRDSEWGSVYAQVVDKFGVQWMLNFNKPA